MALPAHHRIEARLRRDILAGRLAPGMRLPTRRELQLLNGASSVTVQLALDGLAADGFVSSRDRHGSFVALYPPHTHRYGLVLAQLPGEQLRSDLYASSLVEAAARLRRDGRRMELFHAVSQDPDLPEHRALLHAIEVRSLAGLLLPAPWVAERWLDLAAIGLPLAVTAPTLPGAHLARILLDRRAWMDRALDEVQARGLRSVALLIDANQDFTGSVLYFETGAQQRGLSCIPWWIIALDLRWPSWAGRAALGLFNHQQREQPDALIIADDHLVESATRALAEQGGSQPLIIGHANLPMIGPSALPILRLGWDSDSLLAASIVAMETIRTTGAAPSAVHVPLVLVEDDRAPRLSVPGR